MTARAPFGTDTQIRTGGRHDRQERNQRQHTHRRNLIRGARSGTERFRTRRQRLRRTEKGRKARAVRRMAQVQPQEDTYLAYGDTLRRSGAGGSSRAGSFRHSQRAGGLFEHTRRASASRHRRDGGKDGQLHRAPRHRMGGRRHGAGQDHRHVSSRTRQGRACNESQLRSRRDLVGQSGRTPVQFRGFAGNAHPLQSAFHRRQRKAGHDIGLPLLARDVV